MAYTPFSATEFHAILLYQIGIGEISLLHGEWARPIKAATRWLGRGIYSREESEAIANICIKCDIGAMPSGFVGVR